MTEPTKIVLFNDKTIRSHWDAEQESWYFSLVDVVAVLTDSANPTDYLKKLRKRDALLADYLGTNCPQIAMQTVTGKSRKTLAASTQQLLRIIQSIPSKKAEPFKLWLAEVGHQRLNQLQDPELGIEQAMLDYRRLWPSAVVGWRKRHGSSWRRRRAKNWSARKTPSSCGS